MKTVEKTNALTTLLTTMQRLVELFAESSGKQQHLHAIVTTDLLQEADLHASLRHDTGLKNTVTGKVPAQKRILHLM